MYKAILFDADGVLIHAERFSIRLEREYGISTDMTLPFFKGVFQKCLIGQADLKKTIASYLPQWGWKGTVDEFLKCWFESEHKIDAELVEFIKQLKSQGMRVYIATNNETHRTEYLIHEMGFGEVFDKVYGSGHMGFKKPDHQFFDHIIKEQSLVPEETLFVDDDRENIESARELGLHAMLYTNLEDLKQKVASPS